MRAWLAVVVASALAGCGGGAAKPAADAGLRDSGMETAPSEAGGEAAATESGVEASAGAGGAGGAMDAGSDQVQALTDAGDAKTSGDLAGDGATDATTACIQACPHSPGNYCMAGEVERVCSGSVAFADLQALEMKCRGLATDAIRFCCPSTFLAMCP
jgi:hypothetical protein